MNEFEHLMTESIIQLIHQAESLNPKQKVAFQVMSDPELLQTSAGGAAHQSNTGEEIIYLDPSRASEYVVAHELMHMILHRSGWPQMYSISPPEDQLAKNIANEIDNIIDQYLFDPMLIEQGFKVTAQRDWFVAELEKWPSVKYTDPGLIIRDAFTVLESLLYGSPYRRRIVHSFKHSRPEAVALAQRLEGLIDPQKKRTKTSARQSLIKVVKFLDKWLSEKLESSANLQERIGVSPICTLTQLQELAANHIEIESCSGFLNDQTLWVGALSLKADHIRFWNWMIRNGASSEPPHINKIRNHLETKTVSEFFDFYPFVRCVIDE